MNKVSLIIHCSASSFGNAALIDKWHRDRNFNKIGYHFVVLNGQVIKGVYREMYDGLVDTGRDIGEKGAHTYGHNDNIGICLIGNSGDFTINQMTTLKQIIKDMSFMISEVKQHSDFDENKPYCAGLSDSVMEQLNSML